MRVGVYPPPPEADKSGGAKGQLLRPEARASPEASERPGFARIERRVDSTGSPIISPKNRDKRDRQARN